MSRNRRGRRSVALAAVVLLLALPASLSAHVKKIIGAIHLTIGWGDEPALSGFKNTIEVDVSDAADGPVTDLGGPLSVEVAFGDQRITLPLLPAGGRSGKVRAWLVPTRPGTYTFHIMGTVRGQAIDTTSTCSDKTFACVTDASDVEFPVKDPSAGQLAERVSRALPRAEAAVDAASTARSMGLAAIALAAIALAAPALVASIGAGMRKGRKGA